MKKLLALLLAFAMGVSLLACTAKEPAPAVPATEASETTVTTEPAAIAEDIVILYTNDVHTYIDKALSYDVIAALKDALTGKYGNVLLVDAGDAVQGTAYGSMDKGETIIKLMNAAGYDVATLGNHEFDYGMEGAMNVIAWAEFPYISCNFYHEKDGVKGENVLEAFQTFELGGRKIAFVGATTPESFTKSTPAYFQDEMGRYIYGISGGENGAALYADFQTAIDAARADGAEIVIGLGHLGDDPASSPWTSEELIANVSGLNAFIDGHSHSTVVAKEINGTLLTQTGEYFDGIGMMHIDGETGEITTDLIGYTEITEVVVDENGEAVLDENGNETTEIVGYAFASNMDLGITWCVDEKVAAIKNNWIDTIDTQLGTVIGTVDVALGNYDGEGNRLVRSQETNTGDFCTDALYYLFDSMDMDVDVAVMNGGGIRNKDDITGAFSYKTAKEIHTFGNVACLQTITGQQLLDALEWGARCAGSAEENGSFLHVSGITYKIDTAWEASMQEDDKGVWIGGPTGGYRVTDVKVYNKETQVYEPLDLTANYNLAGYNYTLRDLGGGFNMFSGAVNVLDYVMEDYLVLTNYIQGFEDCAVSATNSPLLEKYPGMKLDYSDVNGSGRIEIQ